MSLRLAAAVAGAALAFTAGCTPTDDAAPEGDPPEASGNPSAPVPHAQNRAPALPVSVEPECTLVPIEATGDLLLVTDNNVLNPRRDIVVNSLELSGADADRSLTLSDSWIVDTKIADGTHVVPWVRSSQHQFDVAGTPAEGRVLEAGESYGLALRLSPNGSTKAAGTKVLLEYREGDLDYHVPTGLGLAMNQHCAPGTAQ